MLSDDVALLPDGLAFNENVPAVLKSVSDSLLTNGVVALVETMPHASINLLEGADENWGLNGENGGVCRASRPAVSTRMLLRLPRAC